MYVLLMVFVISATDGVGFPAAVLDTDADKNVIVYDTLTKCTTASTRWKSKAANPAGQAIKSTRCHKIN